MVREGCICYLFFYYIQIVIIIVIFLILILDLFYGVVEFLVFFYVELCQIGNDNIFSYVFFLVWFKNIIIEGSGG